ncbi:hypothetical protein JKP88DRAFT_223227 [Tribonema minus]|uniref:Uncharacterized protein n=1 Tax=Tribonema minus TaxID=303371 RepID=A0A836CCW6_9STRA|nr:hypothetical protein JKP88DRAFT_223227 [Tribonema minus]
MFCFWPIGMIALACSCSVTNRWMQGDLEGAKRAGLMARNLALLAYLCGMIIIICVLATYDDY